MVEQAKYEVLKKIGKTETRRYPRLVIARVDGYGDFGFSHCLKRGIYFCFARSIVRKTSKLLQKPALNPHVTPKRSFAKSSYYLFSDSS